MIKNSEFDKGNDEDQLPENIIDSYSKDPTNQNEDAPHDNKSECIEIVMDYTSIFTNFNYFVSREALQEWVNDVARNYKMVIVVKRSENGLGKKKAQVLLACERGGEYRDTNKRKREKLAFTMDLNDEQGEENDKYKRNDTGTKKCGCPFLLKGKKLSSTEWTLEVKCGTHNHSLAVYLEGHSFLGRLTPEEEKIVTNMSKFQTPVKDILKMLKERNPRNCSTLRTIYNFRKKNKLNVREGRNQLQHLMKLLIDNQYFQHHRTCPQTNTLRELFFAHPTGIQLFRAFPSILIMDCTYKTNRYRLPYLEMVGITSTGMTFSVASTFLQAEKEENYTWALGVLRDILNNGDLPRVILTDRELSLMNVVSSIFPQAIHFLCKWHIDKNVLAKCREKFDTNEKWKTFFFYSWKSVMEASSEEEFANAIRSFHDDYAAVPFECEAYEYCMNQWVNPYKDKFVAAWTNKVMHYENRTTNRVESHHSALKKSLGNSMGNFESCWNRVDTLYQASHNAVKASFEKSVNVAMHKLRGLIFKDLLGLVSIYALEKIYGELQRINQDKFDQKTCDHLMRIVCGLPCTHELHEYKKSGKAIPLEAVDKFWRKLDLEPMLKSENNKKDHVVEDIDSRFEDIVDEIKERYGKGETSQKRVMLRQLIELNNPSTTSMVEPEQKTTTRGRPKAKASKKKDYTSTKRDPSLFEYKESLPFRKSLPEEIVNVEVPYKSSLSQTILKKKSNILNGTRSVTHGGFKDLLPKQFQQYIVDCKNVESDGHCGFRAIAALMGFGEGKWTEVRRGMMNELSHNLRLYARAFREEAMLDEISKALNCFTNYASSPNWFQLPYMGHLVASLYNVAFITLGEISLTFLPLRTALPENPRSICVGHVNGNHFIQVFMARDCPLPPIAYIWHEIKSKSAEGWFEAYKNNQIRL